MSMFCFQCEEASKGEGCTTKGVCGKLSRTAQLQDLLVYLLKGLAVVADEAASQGKPDPGLGRFVAEALFMTITNANFDDARLETRIQSIIARRDALKAAIGFSSHLDAVNWTGTLDHYEAKGMVVGVLSQSDEDVRSLHELLVYGLKGMAAYVDHAAVLG
ncbi:MAG: hydroxylamine reductase, partial [Chromatiaceae bacterium]|nr:hydroxylamine reductase [Chromatiaceae bacterium]